MIKLFRYWTVQFEQDWKILLNVKQIRIWKKAAFAGFSVLSQHLYGKMVESTYWKKFTVKRTVGSTNERINTWAYEQMDAIFFLYYYIIYLTAIGL
jgi:hypothetical protein